jgi:hypothetical protein
MSLYIGRHTDLKNRLNTHLKKLTGLDNDFFSMLNQRDLLDLKTVLADVNNLLTLNMTICAAEWICDFFQFDNSCKQKVLAQVDGTKPNTNGYDIQITESEYIIAEVKCIAPINNGSKYGAAQWNSILDDASKLINGKRSLFDTSGYYKFLFLVDLGARTDQAISHLIRQSKGTSDKPLRANRHKVKEHILLLTDTEVKENLLFDKIYIKSIKLK